MQLNSLTFRQAFRFEVELKTRFGFAFDNKLFLVQKFAPALNAWYNRSYANTFVPVPVPFSVPFAVSVQLPSAL